MVSLRLIVATAGLCTAVACAGGSAPDSPGHRSLVGLESLAGSVQSGGLPVLVPDRRWEAAGGGWSFRGLASFEIHVPDGWPADRSVAVRLRSDEMTLRHHFIAELDGRALVGPTTPSDDGDVLRIDGLEPGSHRLTLRRHYASDSAGLRGETENRFLSIGVQLGDGDVEILDPDREEVYRFVEQFLATGVTGSGRLKAGGMLVRGASTTSIDLAAGETSGIAFRVEAIGSGASFRASVGETSEVVTVSSGEAESFVIRPPGSAERLVLETRGRDDGWYLWGVPRRLGGSGSEHPPVVLVTLDTTRRDAIPPFGDRAESCPNIASFVTGSTVFRDAWATSPWTLPTHASIFTGLYPRQHGAGVSEPRLERKHRTLAELFRTAGYVTVGFAGGELCSSKWGLAQGFDLYVDPDGFETRGDQMTDEVFSVLDDIPTGQPYFLFVNYFDPHALYRAPEPFASRTGVPARADAIDDPLWKALAVSGSGDVWRRVIAGEAPAGSDELRWLEAAYAAEVSFMDHQIGRLLEKLRARSELDEAMVVIVADHGEFLGEHGFFSHGCRLDHELTWIPLIVKWPGQTRGASSNDMVSQIDLFATLGALVGAVPPEGSMAVDLAGPAPRDRTLFMEEHESIVHPLFDNMAIADHLFGVQRSARREVIWDGGIECEELVAGTWDEVRCEQGWRERLEELRRYDVVLSKNASPEHGLTDSDRRALEALGYIQ